MWILGRRVFRGRAFVGFSGWAGAGGLNGFGKFTFLLERRTTLMF